MIKRIVKLTFEPYLVDDFLAIYAASSPLIRAFPGCRHVELLRAHAPDQHVLFTFSHWDNPAALEHYRQSDLFKNTWARTKVLFAAPPAAWTVEEQQP